MHDLAAQRDRMVERQIAARGVRDPAVLAAMRSVPRERFLPPELEEFAYEDSAPAHRAGADDLAAVHRRPDDGGARGSAPTTACSRSAPARATRRRCSARIAREVYTIERHARAGRDGRGRACAQLGFDNVHVRHGDGTLGWPEHAPYDAIVVAAGGPHVPEPLLEQLAAGGRLVIPVGEEKALQQLVRVTRRADGSLEREELGDVRFVPLIGAEGWEAERAGRAAAAGRRVRPPIAQLVREVAEPIDRPRARRSRARSSSASATRGSC